tara:strand:+ start:6919 stop:7059 length:141 start_codon:yes stop_codon:yes gene_type:complete
MKKATKSILRSIEKIEPKLSADEFEEYCDAAHTCITYLERKKALEK